MVARAREFAIAAHGGQVYGCEPYPVRLDAVAELQGPYGGQALIVGYLHDVVEDTSVTLDDLKREFGDQVAAWVSYVTD